MLIRLLRHRFHELSPGAKFFLLRFIQVNEFDAAVGLSVRSLAKQVGVTPEVASSAIEQLLQLGLLTKQSKPRRLGRPSSEYLCSKDAAESLVKDVNADSVHLSRLERLLGDAGGQAGRRLMYANRLLLAVLVAHADRFGVVVRLGLRDLSDLTGLKKEVLRQRLDTLEAQGYIRAIVPGVTGVRLFKRTESQYFLNLGHSMLQAHSAPLSVVLGVRSHYGVDALPARVILQAVKVAKSGGTRSNYVLVRDVSYDVASLFDDHAPNRLEPMLQAKIDGYASWLLSRHFEELAEDFSVYDELMELIQEDFAHVGAEEAASPSHSGAHRNLASLLHNEAVYQALCIKPAIKQAMGGAREGTKFLVLPPSSEPKGRFAYWVLSVIAVDGLPSTGCQVHDDFNGLKRTYTQESEIPLEDRYRYGLLTRPRKSVELGL